MTTHFDMEQHGPKAISRLETVVGLHHWTLVDSKQGLRIKGFPRTEAIEGRDKALLTAPLIGRIGACFLSQKGCLYRLEAPATTDRTTQAAMRARLDRIRPMDDSSPAMGRTFQTLVADQDPTIRRFLAELCESQGFLVQEADSAEHAVDLILQGRTDGAILRVFGNGALGVPVFRMLTAVQWPRKTLFILLESLSDWSVIQNSLGGGSTVPSGESRRLSWSIEALLDGRIGLSHDLLGNPSHSPLRNLHPLSDRERHIATLRGAGVSCRDIAKQLGLSVNTVYAHTRNVARKTLPLRASPPPEVHGGPPSEAST